MPHVVALSALAVLALIVVVGAFLATRLGPGTFGDWIDAHLPTPVPIDDDWSAESDPHPRHEAGDEPHVKTPPAPREPLRAWAPFPLPVAPVPGELADAFVRFGDDARTLGERPWNEEELRRAAIRRGCFEQSRELRDAPLVGGTYRSPPIADRGPSRPYRPTDEQASLSALCAALFMHSATEEHVIQELYVENHLLRAELRRRLESTAVPTAIVPMSAETLARSSRDAAAEVHSPLPAERASLPVPMDPAP